MDPVTARLARCVACVAGLLLLAACAPTGSVTEPTAVVKPPVAPPAQPRLPQGLESVYDLVNRGNLADADQLLHDVWPVPRYAPVALTTPLTWREDPYREKYWRFVFYSLRPTSNLLWAYYRTGEPKYRTKLLDILDSFLTHDAAGRPIEVTGLDDPHVIAFRAMFLVNTYAKLNRSHDLPPALSTRLLDNIERTGAKLLSPENFQVDYNHGFTEAVALTLLHANLPGLDRGNRWRDTGFERLMAFFDRTVDQDGVEVEKSPFYHFYVYKFALQLLAWAKAFTVALPPGLADRVNGMARYASYVLWPDGSTPLLGSSVWLEPEGDRDVYATAMRDNPELAWAITGGETGAPPRDRAVLFGRSGQAILRSPVDASAAYVDNSQLIMDAGPPQTAHSHHEALAFDYYSHGRELIVDSGLDTYSLGQAFSYFHSSTAHNTVVVDGKDSDSGPVRPGLTLAGDGWAYQSGVASVYPGVTHRRSVLLLARDLVLVADAVSSDRPHSFEQLWHLFPGAHVVDTGTLTEVFDENDNPALDLRQASLTTPTELHRYYGELNPMQGWYSAEYGKTEPNHVAGYRTTGTGAVYLTLIASGPYAGRGPDVSGAITGGDVSAEVCVDGYGGASVHIGRQAEPGESVAVTRKPECADVT
jgi:hypothetical protein